MPLTMTRPDWPRISSTATANVDGTRSARPRTASPSMRRTRDAVCAIRAARRSGPGSVRESVSVLITGIPVQSPPDVQLDVRHFGMDVSVTTLVGNANVDSRSRAADDAPSPQVSITEQRFKRPSRQNVLQTVLRAARLQVAAESLFGCDRTLRCSLALNLQGLAAAARGPARVALEARSVSNKRVVAAFTAGIALVTLHSGHLA